MSITDDLAALVATGTLNAEGFTAVLELLSDIQDNVVSHTFWVHTSSGDNTNDGLTAAAPLQTIAAAIAKTPPGSYVRINLLTDYTMEASISTGGRVVRIHGVNSSGTPTQRNFVQTVSGGAARQLSCLNGGAFLLVNLDLYLTKSAISVGSEAFCSGYLKTLFLSVCGLDIESGVTTVSLMGSSGIAILEVDTVTALDDAIAGKWIEGVSASTNPNTLGKVLTNLATL